MPTATIAESPFLIEGKTINEAYAELIASDVDTHTASLIAVGAILENLRGTRRRFSFKTEIPTADVTAKYDFTRTFVHRDWIDGESVVQAESSPTEDGFNDRLHKIEDDIDALGLQIKTAMACIEEIRASFTSRTEEIRSELNYLNSLHDTQPPLWSGPLPTPMPAPEFTPHPQIPPESIFEGITKFNGADVAVWKTNNSLVMLPVQGQFQAHFEKNINVDHRLEMTGKLTQIIKQNEDQFNQIFTNRELSKDQLIEELANRQIADPADLKELLSILPADAKLNSPTNLLNTVSEGHAAALRSEPGVKPAVIKQLGLSSNTINLKEAPIEKLQGIDSDVALALLKNDIKTVEAFNNKPAAELNQILESSNLNIPPERLQKIKNRANLLLRL